jgi:hypothetical protein
VMRLFLYLFCSAFMPNARKEKNKTWNSSWKIYPLPLFYLFHHSGKTDWLSPRIWALLEKPTIALPLKKFPTFCGTRRSIAVFTRTRHWSLFWARWIQSTPHPISPRSTSILSSHLHLGLPSDSFLQAFLTYIKCNTKFNSCFNNHLFLWIIHARIHAHELKNFSDHVRSF